MASCAVRLEQCAERMDTAAAPRSETKTATRLWLEPDELRVAQATSNYRRQACRAEELRMAHMMHHDECHLGSFTQFEQALAQRRRGAYIDQQIPIGNGTEGAAHGGRTRHKLRGGQLELTHQHAARNGRGEARPLLPAASISARLATNRLLSTFGSPPTNIMPCGGRSPVRSNSQAAWPAAVRAVAPTRELLCRALSSLRRS